MGPEAHAEAEVLQSQSQGITAGRLSVSVVTPIGRMLAHEADEVIAPGADGEFGVLAGHVPFISALKPGVLVVRDGKERKIIAVGPGYLQVGYGGRTQILVERAAWPADIDVDEARADKAKLEAELKEIAAHATVEARTITRLTGKLAWAQARLDAAAAK